MHFHRVGRALAPPPRRWPERHFSLHTKIASGRSSGYGTGLDHHSQPLLPSFTPILSSLAFHLLSASPLIKIFLSRRRNFLKGTDGEEEEAQQHVISTPADSPHPQQHNEVEKSEIDVDDQFDQSSRNLTGTLFFFRKRKSPPTFPPPKNSRKNPASWKLLLDWSYWSPTWIPSEAPSIASTPSPDTPLSGRTCTIPSPWVLGGRDNFLMNENRLESLQQVGDGLDAPFPPCTSLSVPSLSVLLLHQLPYKKFSF